MNIVLLIFAIFGIIVASLIALIVLCVLIDKIHFTFSKTRQKEAKKSQKEFDRFLGRLFFGG